MRPGGEEDTDETVDVEAMDNECSGFKLVMPPSSKPIPRVDMKRGTTTLGFRFKNGVIVAVDSRASTGQYIASATVLKILQISPWMVGTMAGGAADCQYWIRVLGQECRLWELRNKERPSVAAASKILANILYHYRHQGLSIGSMIAGVDKHGPQLYYLDSEGSRLQGDKFSAGSGSIYAYGVMDQGWKFDMETDEAIELGRRAIYTATERDAGSGGLVGVVHIDLNNGVNWVGRTDTWLLHRQYLAGSAQ
jgi:20S proteasome subunit beta 5